jgi:hypothetical protein
MRHTNGSGGSNGCVPWRRIRSAPLPRRRMPSRSRSTTGTTRRRYSKPAAQTAQRQVDVARASLSKYDQQAAAASQAAIRARESAADPEKFVQHNIAGTGLDPDDLRTMRLVGLKRQGQLTRDEQAQMAALEQRPSVHDRVDADTLHTRRRWPNEDLYAWQRKGGQRAGPGRQRLGRRTVQADRRVAQRPRPDRALPAREAGRGAPRARRGRGRDRPGGRQCEQQRPRVRALDRRLLPEEEGRRPVVLCGRSVSRGVPSRARRASSRAGSSSRAGRAG